MSDQQPKTCGECMTYRPYKLVRDYGQCTTPLSDSIPICVRRAEMHRNTPADTCPCFEPTEADHEPL